MNSRLATFFLITTLIALGAYSALHEPPDKKQQTEPSPLSTGEQFHMASSQSWGKTIKESFLLKRGRPPLYKRYPNAEIISLPQISYKGITVEDALRKRRSRRSYSDKPLSLEALSQLLFAAQGVTGREHGKPRRTAPSAGALYPMETYIAVNTVTGLSPGLYHYRVEEHDLERISNENLRWKLTRAGLGQDMLADADVVFILSAVFTRSRYKYGERGFRYSYMEAGHISQNIALQAVSLGLGSVGVGAFIDKDINRIIGADGINEATLYLHAVGTL